MFLAFLIRVSFVWLGLSTICSETYFIPMWYSFFSPPPHSSEDVTQELEHTRQVLYCWATPLFPMWDSWCFLSFWRKGWALCSQDLKISPQLALLAKHVWPEFIQSPNKSNTPSGRKSNPLVTIFSEIKKSNIFSQSFIIISNLTSETLIAIMKDSEYSKSSKVDKAIKAQWNFWEAFQHWGT